MKYFIYPLLLFQLLNFRINIAQENNVDSIFNQNKTGKISGFVYDDITRSRLTHAVIKIIDFNDSVKFKGTETDSTGHFLIEEISYGTYKIEVSLTGYNKYIKSPFTIDSSNNDLALDSIMLKTDSPVTEEIDVEGEKGLIQFGPDKKIFNAEKNITTKGENALDLLKKVPLVSVDANDNVKMRGSANIKILIDGKESAFYKNLKQLPADMIKTVELITNPSAKYESEGVSGIINLVLKKNIDFGVNGNIYLSASSNENYSGSLNLNIKKGPVTLMANYYPGIYRYTYNAISKRENLISPISYLEQTSTGNFKSQYQYISGGLEYEINKIHSISFEAFYLPAAKQSGSEDDKWINKNSSESITSYTLRKNYYDFKNKGYSFALDYTGKLDTNERELSGNISYNIWKGDMNTNQVNRQYDSLNSPVYFPLLQNDYRYSKYSNFNSQMNYFHPFNKETSIETGLKGFIRINDNDFISDTLNNSINQFQTNTGVSNHFKFAEQVYSFYIVFGSKIKSFSYKLGLRLEQTITKGELFTTGDIYKNDYLSIFPSINLSYMLAGMQQIQASYSRRITRPSAWRVNPFKNQWDPYNIARGNPDLKPEYTDSYELSYMLYWKQISLTPSAFFRYTRDVISRYSYLSDSNITVTTYRNLSTSKSYGLDIMTNSTIFPWWMLNGTVSFYQQQLEGDNIDNYVSEKGFSWNANITAYFNFPKIINIQLFYNYWGRRLNAQGENKATQQLDAGISKSFLDNKLTFNLKVNDILKLNDYNSEINGAGFKQTYTSDYDSRVVSLTVSYMFGKQDPAPKKRKRTDNTTQDQNNQGDNGLK